MPATKTFTYTNSFLPSTGKPGKTIHLLKAASKPVVSGKKRKKIPVLGSLQDYQAQQAQKDHGAPGFKATAQKLAQSQAAKAQQKKQNEMND